MKVAALTAPILAVALAACGATPTSDATAGRETGVTTGESSVASESSSQTFSLDGEGDSQSTSETSPSETAEDQAQPLIVTDVKYTTSTFGDDVYILYGFTATNPNDGVDGEFPTFRVTARGKDGSILDTDDAVLFEIPASGTVIWDSQLSASEKPESVEAVFVKATWVNTDLADGPVAKFSAGNVSGKPDGSQYRVTGEIVNESESLVEQARVGAVLRNKAGEVVGYGSTYVDTLPPGMATPFDLYAWFSSKPDSVEIVTTEW